MIDQEYNPTDPEFLLSRSFDETLSDDEQCKLDEALDRSETLRTEGEKLRAIGRLIKRAGTQPVDTDWDRFAASVDQACQAQEDGTRGKIDTLLGRWGKREAQVDWDRFAAGVTARIGRHRTKRSYRQVILRLGAPLAAAAAVALAVTAYFSVTAATRVSVVSYQQAWTETESVSVSRVSFSRQPAAEDPTVRSVRGIGFSVVAATPLVDYAEESPLP